MALRGGDHDSGRRHGAVRRRPADRHELARPRAQAYTGYWRVGGDNLNGWNLDPWGSNSQGTTQPHSYYFNGTIADVAVYPAALSAAQVAAHYAAALQQGISQ